MSVNIEQYDKLFFPYQSHQERVRLICTNYYHITSRKAITFVSIKHQFQRTNQPKIF